VTELVETCVTLTAVMLPMSQLSVMKQSVTCQQASLTATAELSQVAVIPSATVVAQ